MNEVFLTPAGKFAVRAVVKERQLLTIIDTHIIYWMTVIILSNVRMSTDGSKEKGIAIKQISVQIIPSESVRYKNTKLVTAAFRSILSFLIYPFSGNLFE